MSLAVVVQAGRLVLYASGLAVVLGAAVGGGLLVGAEPVLALLGAGPDTGDMHDQALVYLQWRAAAAPAVMLSTVAQVPPLLPFCALSPPPSPLLLYPYLTHASLCARGRKACTFANCWAVAMFLIGRGIFLFLPPSALSVASLFTPQPPFARTAASSGAFLPSPALPTACTCTFWPPPASATARSLLVPWSGRVPRAGRHAQRPVGDPGRQPDQPGAGLHSHLWGGVGRGGRGCGDQRLRVGLGRRLRGTGLGQAAGEEPSRSSPDLGWG